MKVNDKDEALIAAHKRDTYEAPEHLKQQWHDAIDRAAAMENGRKALPAHRWAVGPFLWGMGVSAAIATLIIVGAGRLSLPPTDVPQIANESQSDVKIIPASLTRGLTLHLLDSRKQLANLSTDGDSAMLIMQLIEQNRLFEAAADQNNAPRLARVLRAFEPILLRLAATDIAPEDAAALRAQLSFELNVMLTKLANESSDDSHST